MLFNRIKGQRGALTILRKAVTEDIPSHSYLFMGPDGVGKFTTALYFGMALNCLDDDPHSRPCGKCSSCKKMLSFSHPDFIYLFPTPNYEISPTGEIKDAKNLSEYESYLKNKKVSPWRYFYFQGNTAIRLDCIRMLQHRINLSFIEARYKVVVIEKADYLNVHAANAFLKTLEEPPENVVIILTSSRNESMLSTIISRCQKVNFNRINLQTIEDELFFYGVEDAAQIKMIARIANGNMEKALNTWEAQSSETRAKMRELLDIIIQGDDLSFLKYAEHYKTSKSLNELSEVLHYLIVWLGDVVFFLESPEEIINIDMTAELDKVAANNPYLTDMCPELIVFLETMLKRLEGNVNPHLVIIEVYNHLKPCIRGRI